MSRQQVITPSTVLPITLDYAKLSLKHTSGDVENDLLTTFIQEAAERAEHYTGLRLTLTTLADYDEEWPVQHVFWNPGNVLSVEKVEYMPEDSDSYTALDSGDYIADLNLQPARLRFVADSLPDLNEDHPEAIKITYKAGYTATAAEDDQRAAIPAGLRQAVAIQAAHWYMYRTDYVKKSNDSASTHLLNRYRVAWL